MDFSSFNDTDERPTHQLVSTTSSLQNNPVAQLSQLEATMRMNDNNSTQQWTNSLDEMALQNQVFQPLETDQFASIVSSQRQTTNNPFSTDLGLPRLQPPQPQDNSNKMNKPDDKTPTNQLGLEQQTNNENNIFSSAAAPRSNEHRVRMDRGFNGLAYAEECKEKAREEYKEMKRKEHIANGQIDRLKRRRKNDSSMTTDQKYRRRLQMNQDSAAAARYAQDIYVRTLEKLVQESEMQINNLQQVVQGVQKMESEREIIISQLIARNRELELMLQQQKKNIPHPAWIDTMTAPETMSAQANDAELAAGNVGVRPAPAV